MIVDFHTHNAITAENVLVPRSFGFHPWHLQGLEQLGEPVDADDVDLIGECGLDRCCATPWDLQQEAFIWHLQLAERLRKPVVVHCVRAYNELVDLRRQGRWEMPWVVHGFVGSPQLALLLQQWGIGVSFGAAITDPRRTKPRESLRTLGLGNFFLETDTSPVGIGAVYSAAAAILDCDTKLLEDTINTQLTALLRQ